MALCYNFIIFETSIELQISETRNIKTVLLVPKQKINIHISNDEHAGVWRKRLSFCEWGKTQSILKENVS